jgi:hypothetical protein
MKILGLAVGSEMDATTAKILTDSEMMHAAIMEIINICGLVACIVLALSAGFMVLNSSRRITIFLV